MALDSRGRFTSQQTSNEITVEELLNVAKLQGGAVAEVAEELSHPQRSILATVGKGFGKAFGGFIDVISAPGQIVAGALSSKYTIRETLQDNINVSDVILGEEKKNLTTSQKVGSFITRMAIDVLTDPLTYVTFGASKGIFGVTALPKTFSGRATTKALGLKQEGTAIGLNTRAEKFAEGYVEAMRNGSHHMYIPREIRRMQKAGEIGEDFVFDPKKMLKARDEVEKSLTDSILNSRLSKSEAVRSMGKLLEAHPALVETFVDKGGIKFFGKSILSGQRIRGVKQMIPGMTLLDNITYPLRNTMHTAFNRDVVMTEAVVGGGGKISDEAIETAQKYRDLAESASQSSARILERTVRTLGISKQEDEFIRNAIVLGLEPADSRNAQIWAKANNIDKPGPIREEVWKAADIYKDSIKRYQYQALRDAGVRISNQEGYIKDVLVKTPISSRMTTKSGKIKSSSTLFTKASVLVDDAGNRYPTRFDAKPTATGEVTGEMFIDGELMKKTFKYIDSKREIQKINDILTKNETSLFKELSHLKKESGALGEGVKASLVKETTDEIVKRLSDIKGIGKEEIKSIAESVSKYIDDADITTIVGKRLKNFYKDGIKLKGTHGVENIPVSKLEDIIAELSTQKVLAKNTGRNLLSRVNKVLKDHIQLPSVKESKFTKLQSEEMIDAASRDLIDTIKKEIKLTKQKILDEGINEKNLNGLISQIVGRTAKNPGALKSVLDKLIKNKQLANDLFEELDDVKRAAEIDVEKAIEEGGKFVDTVSGKALERARATADEKEILGFKTSKSATVSALLGIQEAQKVAATRNFFNEMAEKAGKVASEAPDGWRQVSVTGLKHEGDDIAKLVTGKKGEEIYFHPLIAKYIEDFGKTLGGDEATESIMKAYDKIQNVFKASVTSIFPAFHGRNAISNVFLNYLDIGLHAMNPKTSYEAGRMISQDIKLGKVLDKIAKGEPGAGRKYGEMMSEVIFKGNDGYEWTFGELHTIMKQNVVAFNPRNLGQIDQAMHYKDDILHMQKELFETNKIKSVARNVNPFSTKNKAVKSGLRVGQAVEDYARSVNFIANLRATGDPLLAAQRTKMFLFDYQNLSNFERTFLRRIIPFYTFTRKNLELQLNTLFTRPGRIAQEVRAVQQIGQSFWGADQLTDEERAVLPQWMQQGVNTVLKREGSTVSVLNSLGLPFEQPFQQFQKNQALASVSPIIRYPAEAITGYSTFRGKMISDVTNAQAFRYAPEPLKDFIGFTEVKGVNNRTGEEFTYWASLRPWRMHMVMNLPPTSRIIGEIDGLTDPDRDRAIKAYDFLFGFNPRDNIDLELEAERREGELRAELERVLDTANVGYKIERYIPPKN